MGPGPTQGFTDVGQIHPRKNRRAPARIHRYSSFDRSSRDVSSGYGSCAIVASLSSNQPGRHRRSISRTRLSCSSAAMILVSAPGASTGASLRQFDSMRGNAGQTSSISLQVFFLCSEDADGDDYVMQKRCAAIVGIRTRASAIRLAGQFRPLCGRVLEDWGENALSSSPSSSCTRGGTRAWGMGGRQGQRRGALRAIFPDSD